MLLKDLHLEISNKNSYVKNVQKIIRLSIEKHDSHQAAKVRLF